MSWVYLLYVGARICCIYATFAVETLVLRYMPALARAMLKPSDNPSIALTTWVAA